MFFKGEKDFMMDEHILSPITWDLFLFTIMFALYKVQVEDYSVRDTIYADM